ncbi:sensor histidine kinase [Rhodococcus rhodochrous]|uniref:sensor histidine kinase n=1 Tax=Rhodococcus rhodochrous TaxID=1829 RepID=UPI0017859ECC|nr:ATP-binding protein [Rhodococcus rhodochrous]QOH59787.1 two-component sensor histidine kinase [Rhodococcus rhodochrous]
MTARSSTPGGSLRRTANTASFGTRLFLALTVVVLGCAISAWIVASALAPGIFHDHLGQAGIDHNSSQARHVEEAFTWAIILAWGLAIAIAVLLSLAVSWYITRRVQRSLTAVTTSTAQIAAGHYDARIHSPGLGREFDELTVTVNEVARRLEATETTRRRMLADLGHEMRTPIATLDSYLEALEDGVRSLDEDTLQILRAATQRLDRLAQDITAVSRAEEHLTRITPIPTDTATLITAAAEAVRTRYDDKGVTLDTRIEQSVPVTVDPDRFGQVLGNLLDNALRHTPDGGTVTITCRQLDPTHAEIVVADTGEGIAAEHLDHLFDRFYRADLARNRRHGGSGIGLTITRALIEAHRGRIRAASDGPGRGARFTIDLPSTGTTRV